jgi:hypothetical protein
MNDNFWNFRYPYRTTCSNEYPARRVGKIKGIESSTLCVIAVLNGSTNYEDIYIVDHENHLIDSSGEVGEAVFIQKAVFPIKRGDLCIVCHEDQLLPTLAIFKSINKDGRFEVLGVGSNLDQLMVWDCIKGIDRESIANFINWEMKATNQL